jgi:TRAP-type C4-dicarboxylate transport system permease large subunit
VIFGVAANVSIGKLFMAGIVPGLLMGRVAVPSPGGGWRATENVIAAAPGQPRPTSLKALRESTWALVLPVIVIWSA